ncbi:MAG: BamA/TamA family outer membrane protein [Leptospiraceae bacterium]|nr:BamA/TamA family outer membrane protein [Leptospiraceae bacterium]
MKKLSTLLLIFSLLALPASLWSEEEDSYGWGFTPLPLPSYDDDIGFTYGLRVTATKTHKDYKPFSVQIWAQYLASTKGYEDHAVYADVLDVFGTGLRVKGKLAYARTLLAQYYGYGNEHDIRRQQKIQEGKVAINENIPSQKTIITGEDLQGTDAFGWLSDKWADELNLNENFLRDPVGNIANLSAVNPGRRILRERQNRFFAYDRTRPYVQLSTENFIGNSDFKWFLGFRGQRYKVQSYYDRREGGEAEANSKTLVDIEQPYGYDAISEGDPRFVNAVRVALAYDSRPRARELNPNSGIFTDLHYEGVGKATGSHYQFHRATATWRQYIEILPSVFNKMGDEFVFAYRLQAQETFGDVPFFEKGRIYTMNEESEGLGGSGGLRGYPSNQFVDKVMTMANIEGRYTFAKTGFLGGMDFQLMGFYDIGRVAADWSEWQPKGMHKAYGPGIGMIWQKNTIVTIFRGTSPYESFTAFKLSHMF